MYRIPLVVICLALMIPISKGQVSPSSSDSIWATKAEEAYAYGRQNLYRNPDSVLHLFENLERHINDIKDTSMKFNVYNVPAIVYQSRFQLDKSDSLLGKAAYYAEISGDTSLLFKVNNNKAINNRHRGNYKEALKVYQSNLVVVRQAKLSVYEGITLSEIGNVFLLLENWNKGLEYQLKAFARHKENGDTLRIGNTYNSLASIYSEPYFDEKDFDKALLYADSAISCHYVSGSLFGLANAQRKKCSIIGMLKKANESLVCYTDLLEMDIKLNNRQGLMIDYVNIGRNLTNLERHKEALVYFKKAVSYSKEIGEKRVLASTFHALSINYHNLEDDENAYLYADSARVLKDSLRGMELNKELAELNVKYELTEKEKQLLEETNKSNVLTIQKAEAENRLNQRNIWVIVLVSIVVLVLVFFYYRIKLNKKQHELEQEELLKAEKQKALKGILDGQEEERKRIAKDLHDGIGQKLTGLRLAWKNLATDIQNDDRKTQIDELTKVVNDSAEEVRAISHKMMPIALREVGLSAAIESMLEETFRFSKINYHYDQSNADGRFDERVEVSLYRICQELVNNSVKHSNATEVSVQLLKSKKYLMLLVEDNGKGVDIPSFKKGQGFLNITSRLSVNQGDINLESNKNKGLLVQVRINI